MRLTGFAPKLIVGRNRALEKDRMPTGNRRDFLRLGATAGAAALFPDSIMRALAVPAAQATGTIKDVEHVVILMHENRSFDHYFGSMRGVRGLGDPHPIPLKGGGTVWHQPWEDGWSPFTPFHLDTRTTSAQRVPDLNHGWEDSQGAMNHGSWDGWIANKIQSIMPDGDGFVRTPRPGLTVGYYRREDIPFQFALAEAFTVCDAYHCSIRGSTTPNRVVLWTGGNDPTGAGGGPVIDNSSANFVKSRDEIVSKESLTSWNAKGYGKGPRYTFSTYPERLEKAGIGWKIYQEADGRMTMNALVAFDNFAWADKSSSFWKRAMTGWSIDDLKRDVMADTLPPVSWVIPGEINNEHPYSSSPIQGADHMRHVIEALTANPEVWAKTVLFVNFDESDGFFDHMPAPSVPSILPDGTMAGASTIDIAGEIHGPDKLPFGLGPRVPMMVVSPWSKGGWVNSELFDHTSVIRFLEARFGVIEPNITPWRRAVCGDLTSCFDFARPGAAAFPPLPDVSKADAVVAVQSKLPVPTPPVSAEPLFQEKGTRPSRPLPYELSVDATTGADGGVTLAFVSSGTATAVFQVYDKQALDRPPRRYTVEPGKSLTGAWPKADGYDLWVYGPNGFLRAVSGPTPGLELTLRQDRATGGVTLIAANKGTAARTVTVKAEAYRTGGPWSLTVAAGGKAEQSWSLADSGHWYDLSASDGATAWRFAGRVETGKPGISDPRMGAG
jgi:phospholipase C